MQKGLRKYDYKVIVAMLLIMYSNITMAQKTLIPTHTTPLEQTIAGVNLVKNPSFEEYYSCPEKIDAHGVLTIVKDWFQPTSGSADYYNVCGMRECGVPRNKLGVQYPHSGNGYCGIYCSKTDYREYLQTKLLDTLQVGKRYELTFYVSLSEYSSGSVATIGALFSRNCLQDTGTYTLMHKEVISVTPTISQTIATYYTPQVQNDYFRVLTNTASWSKISGIFVAEGGEQYLTIGNFLPANQSNLTDLETLTYLLPGSYYYIDDISLYCLSCDQQDTILSVSVEEKKMEAVAVEESSVMANKYIDSVLQVGATFILENIYFDFDESTLLAQSYEELQKLLQILFRYPAMTIEVGGHTDARGAIDYNQYLSESRAKAVVDYLITNGVDQRRLQYNGYGKSKPIDTNDTDEGRARNRRVEFRILSM